LKGETIQTQLVAGAGVSQLELDQDFSPNFIRLPEGHGSVPKPHPVERPALIVYCLRKILDRLSVDLLDVPDLASGNEYLVSLLHLIRPEAAAVITRDSIPAG
jgi:hypothetical protein